MLAKALVGCCFNAHPRRLIMDKCKTSIEEGRALQISRLKTIKRLKTRARGDVYVSDEDEEDESVRGGGGPRSSTAAGDRIPAFDVEGGVRGSERGAKTITPATTMTRR